MMSMRTQEEIELKFEELKREYKKMSESVGTHTIIDAGKYIALAATLRIISWILGYHNTAFVEPEEGE